MRCEVVCCNCPAKTTDELQNMMIVAAEEPCKGSLVRAGLCIHVYFVRDNRPHCATRSVAEVYGAKGHHTCTPKPMQNVDLTGRRQHLQIENSLLARILSVRQTHSYRSIMIQAWNPAANRFQWMNGWMLWKASSKIALFQIVD
jgi:hypothetical protein